MRLRSDVPIAFSLAKSVDLNVLVGFVKKPKKDIKCYSIVDNDQRFNEQKNINISKSF